MFYTLLIVLLPMILIVGAFFIANLFEDGFALEGFIGVLIIVFIAVIVAPNLALLVENSEVNKVSDDNGNVIFRSELTFNYGLSQSEFLNGALAIENDFETEIVVINSESGQSYSYTDGSYLVMLDETMAPGVYSADVERITKVWFFKTYETMDTEEIAVIVVPSAGYKVADTSKLQADEKVTVGLQSWWPIYIPVVILIVNSLLCYFIEFHTSSELVITRFGSKGPLWILELGLITNMIYIVAMIFITYFIQVL